MMSQNRAKTQIRVFDGTQNLGSSLTHEAGGSIAGHHSQVTST